MIKTFCDFCGESMEAMKIKRDFLIGAHLISKPSETLRPIDFSIHERSAAIHLHRKCQLKLLIDAARSELDCLGEMHEDKLNKS